MHAQCRSSPFRLRLITLLIMGTAVPFLCTLPINCYRQSVPSEVLGLINERMTRAHVVGICGRPHNRWGNRMPDGEHEYWEYYIREFMPTAFLNPTIVKFDASGRVEKIWVQ